MTKQELENYIINSKKMFEVIENGMKKDIKICYFCGDPTEGLTIRIKEMPDDPEMEVPVCELDKNQLSPL